MINNKIKILIMNIPGATTPSDFPPVAITRVIDGVDKQLNCEFNFLNLDLYRPNINEITQYIKAFNPQVVAFSAVLTPSYSYLKNISLHAHKSKPEAVQILGGQMSVLSNIIIQKTAVRFCIVGESEPTFSLLIRQLSIDNYLVNSLAKYRTIKEIVFMDDGISFFTGYLQKSNLNLDSCNYEIINDSKSIEQYIQNVRGPLYAARINQFQIYKFYDYFHAANSYKFLLQMFASKGCTGKCTFCHRFYKGYSVASSEAVVKYIEHICKQREIGLVYFCEENFGVNKKITSQILYYLKAKHINWAAGAVRVDTIDEETIKFWKDTGCVHLNFGIETCSQNMLNVMEKRVTVNDNLDAIRLCYKYNILTIIGLVIGMPGETDQTIDETIQALSTVIPDNIETPFELCINYFMAVPGTPGYEFARATGKIGTSLDEEEKYIESLYAKDANDYSQYLNFTDFEKEETLYWKYYIFLELSACYIKRHGLFNVLKKIKLNRYKYAAIYMLMPRKIRRILLKYLCIIKHCGIINIFWFFHRKLFRTKIATNFSKVDKSLRKVNATVCLAPREDDTHTYVLRTGR